MIYGYTYFKRGKLEIWVSAMLMLMETNNEPRSILSFSENDNNGFRFYILECVAKYIFVETYIPNQQW